MNNNCNCVVEYNMRNYIRVVSHIIDESLIYLWSTRCAAAHFDDDACAISHEGYGSFLLFSAELYLVGRAWSRRDLLLIASDDYLDRFCLHDSRARFAENRWEVYFLPNSNEPFYFVWDRESQSTVRLVNKGSNSAKSEVHYCEARYSRNI